MQVALVNRAPTEEALRILPSRNVSRSHLGSLTMIALGAREPVAAIYRASERILLGNLTTLSLGASPLQNASQAYEKHLVEARLSKKMRRAAPAGIIPSWAGVR